jgi:A/G-specific adenine glycosylase
MSDQSAANFFVAGLLAWASTAVRPLPWKNTRNPYYIWLSEVLLQQTRAEQGLPYYERFVSAFPTVQDLAAADEAEVLKNWQGLGYYARARNLHRAAQYIVDDLGGVFPDTYADILALRGVGDYTAAAIASFAFGLPYAVVDGNVYRVLARFFGISTPIDTPKGKKEFADLAQSLLNKSDAGRYNQAIMDFGATHCRPRQPLCATCGLQSQCAAYQSQSVATLPVKSKKMSRKQRFFYYFVYTFADNIYLRRRESGDVWEGLHDFVLLELAEPIPAADLLTRANIRAQFLPPDADVRRISAPFRQLLTHQDIRAVFIAVQLAAPLPNQEKNIFATPRGTLQQKYAFPKLILDYLADANPQEVLLF